MLRLNKQMKALLSSDAPEVDISSLEKILDGGFVKKGECYFVRSLYKDHYDKYTIDQFQDETGFETFMNSLHIEDFYKNSCLDAAVAFVNLAMDVWRKYTSNVDLVGIISTKDNKTVVNSIRNDLSRTIWLKT